MAASSVRKTKGAEVPKNTSFKLRSDLEIEAVEEQDALRYVIKDPRTDRYFRIKPLEYFLIGQFDGKSSLDDIRRAASEHKNVLVSEDVLERFAKKFHELGLLESDQPSPDPAQAAGTGIFSVKFPFKNPEHLVDRLYEGLGWCCTTPFVVLMGLTIALATILAIGNSNELVFGLGSVISAHGALMVIVTITGVTILHEMAHAITCRHFSGRVTDMGFLLLYFIPCFYCNVSDAHLFREKRQRLWVFFAGGFFELFIWAVSVILWRVSAPGTALSGIFVIIVAVCGIRSLFNFNPLIRMDGYFLLADALGIANLRRESFAGLARVFRRIIGLAPTSASDALRSRRILSLPGDVFVTLFGIAAVVYTISLVAYVTLFSGGFVFDRFGADALGLFTVALIGLLHKPAISAAESAKDVGKEKWSQLGSAGRRVRFFLFWIVPTLIVLFFPWQLRITSELAVLPQEREIVRAPADGRISRIYIPEGGRVEAGELLLEYDTDELMLERRTLQASLSQASQELRLLGKPSPTFKEEIVVQESALVTAKALEVAAAQDFARSQQLWTNGLISEEELVRNRNALAAASARREEVEARIALVRKESPASRTEQMEVLHLKDTLAQQAVIEKLEAEIEQIDDRLSRSKIFASISGTLTTYRFEETVGDFLEEGVVVCEIANDDRVVLEIPVDEKDFDVIEIGQTVQFKVRGYPYRSFHTTVDEIAPTAHIDGTTSKILVRGSVDNDENILIPGMTGVAKIYAGQSFVLDIWTRDIIRFIRTEFWL